MQKLITVLNLNTLHIYATCKIMWIQSPLDALDMMPPIPMPMYYDN